MSNTEQNRNEFEFLKELNAYAASHIGPFAEQLKTLSGKISVAIADLSEKKAKIQAEILEQELKAQAELAEKEQQEAVVSVAGAADAESDLEPSVAIKEEAVPEEGAAASPTPAEQKPAAKTEAEKEVESKPKANDGFTTSKTFTYDANQRRSSYDPRAERGARPQGAGTGGTQDRRPPQGGSGTRPGYAGGQTSGAPRGAAPRPGDKKPAEFAKPAVAAKEAPKKKKTFDKDDNKKGGLNKKSMIKKGYAPGVPVIDPEDDRVRHVKARRSKKQEFTPNTVNIETAVINTKEITIKSLSEKIGKTAAQIIKKLFELGESRTINELISFEQAELIAMEFGITLELKLDKTAEDKMFDLMVDHADATTMVKRPPVVTIMGHVDHGKTSLLDYIRESNVVSGEAGGITQHIGAYTIELNGEPITFLDTPGHEAFTSMRLRGAMVTDIAIIVVAADDGIMPQTVEAISHAKKAGVSVMVAINKMDKASANPDRIKQQLTQYELVPEEWGGDVIVCPVSAKTGEGVQNLLENILLLAEVKELKANVDCPAQGSIVEARLDKGTGPVATVLIQNGTLKVADFVVAGNVIGKVRAMSDYKGNKLKEAGPSIAVSVLGFQEVPNAGDQMIVVENEKLAKQVVEERKEKERSERSGLSAKRNLEDMFKNIAEGEKKTLNVIIKADVQGSVEAIKQALEKLSDELSEKGVNIGIVHQAVGAINESDIMLADTASAVVIGFNVRPEPKAKALAERSEIDIKCYRIIYDVIDDIKKAMQGMLDPVFREEVLGHAEVREVFRITGVGTIGGCYVTDGKIARNANLRLLREHIVIHEGQVSSLKRMKDDVKEVATGYECGIGIDKYNDIKVGDIIEAFISIRETNE